MDYLPNNATIDEACEWLQHQTGQKWTLPRLLEDGHLTPYVWIDYAPGLPQIFGDRLEGYLTMMVYHGDVMRLAADRNEALLTMFTAHDGTLARTEPAWRVELKDVRFQKQDIKRVAEIINTTAPILSPATPAPVVTGGKKWTPEKLAELKTYREAHTMPETAVKFGISEQRIRDLLPSKKPKAKPFAGLIHRMK